MIFTQPVRTRNFLVDVIARLVDVSTKGPGVMEILTSDGRVLAKLKFQQPSAYEAQDGTVRFLPIGDGSRAVSSGVAATARAFDGDGEEIFSMDVSDLMGEGYLKLNTTSITAGGPIIIKEFTLTMPSGE